METVKLDTQERAASNTAIFLLCFIKLVYPEIKYDFSHFFKYGQLTFTLLHSITRYLKRAMAVRSQIEAIPRKVRRNPVALHILEPMSHPNLDQGCTVYISKRLVKVLYSYLADAQKSTGMPYTATTHSPKSRFIKSRLKSVRSLKDMAFT